MTIVPRPAHRQGRGSVWLIGLILACVGLVFLYVPLVTAIVYSFNKGVDGLQTAKWAAFSFNGYVRAWHDDSLMRALQSGAQVAVWVMVLATILGTALGYGAVRHRTRVVRNILGGLIALLLIVPEVVLGSSMLQLVSTTQIPLSMTTMVVALTPMTSALVAFVVRAATTTLHPELEDASRDLGANGPQTLWFVVLPQLLPSIVIGAVLALTLAFDNLVIASFLSTPDVSTLAVYLYSTLNYGPSPEVYAATSAVFLATVLLLGIVGLCWRWQRRVTSARERQQ